MQEKKDFLPFYFGCEVMGECAGERRKGHLTGLTNGGTECEIQFFNQDGFNLSEEPEFNEPEKVILLLRPLSTMTEAEAIELAKLSEYEPHFRNPRVERNKFDDLIVYWNDDHEYFNSTGELFYCYEQFMWMCKNEFDIFQLIEKGFAIAKEA